MNWKLVVGGGLVFFVATFAVGFITGPLIHDGVLKETYREHSDFWLPPLQQDPPDMGALMPRWIFNGILTSLVIAAIYGWVRPALKGSGWKRGLHFGLGVAIMAAVFLLGYSGVFNLPTNVWIWWGIDGLVLYSVAGAALGWFGDRYAA